MSRFAAQSFFFAALAIPALAPAANLEALVRDASGNPVADAVVFATSASGHAEAKTARTVAVEQVDREFVPYVSVIQAGTAVTFPNRDAILHHVYSFSPVKSFEFKLYTGKSPGEIVFEKPGVVTLGCNIHDWMIAYILVVPTPHFAKTGADGVARLRGLSAGNFEVKAWHPQQRATAAARAAALEPATELRLDFEIDAAPRKVKFKPPLDRLRY